MKKDKELKPQVDGFCQVHGIEKEALKEAFLNVVVEKMRSLN